MFFCTSDINKKIVINKTDLMLHLINLSLKNFYQFDLKFVSNNMKLLYTAVIFLICIDLIKSDCEIQRIRKLINFEKLKDLPMNEYKKELEGLRVKLVEVENSLFPFCWGSAAQELMHRSEKLDGTLKLFLSFNEKQKKGRVRKGKGYQIIFTWNFRIFQQRGGRLLGNGREKGENLHYRRSWEKIESISSSKTFLWYLRVSFK